MKLQSFQPPVSLSNYVHSITVLEDDALKADCIIPLIAKGYPSITFQVTAPGVNNNDCLVLYGQNLKPFEFYASEHLTIIAYFLHPHVLHNFFGFSAHEVTDMCIDLSLMQPARPMGLKERLLNETALETRLQLMNNYIATLAQSLHTQLNGAVTFATQTILRNNGLASLKSIHHELGVTERTFQRLFEFHVGVSPKMFSRICQFNSAFEQLSNKRFDKLSDIAYDNGYADQSHLIRVFKEFTNVGPKEYLRLSSEFEN
ncbi:MAG TPA: helix-turn-helix domain-containing protein [Mucilaginibacter sp.]